MFTEQKIQRQYQQASETENSSIHQVGGRIKVEYDWYHPNFIGTWDKTDEDYYKYLEKTSIARSEEWTVKQRIHSETKGTTTIYYFYDEDTGEKLDIDKLIKEGKADNYSFKDSQGNYITAEEALKIAKSEDTKTSNINMTTTHTSLHRYDISHEPTKYHDQSETKSGYYSWAGNFIQVSFSGKSNNRTNFGKDQIIQVGEKQGDDSSIHLHGYYKDEETVLTKLIYKAEVEIFDRVFAEAVADAKVKSNNPHESLTEKDKLLLQLENQGGLNLDHKKLERIIEKSENGELLTDEEAIILELYEETKLIKSDNYQFNNDSNKHSAYLENGAFTIDFSGVTDDWVEEYNEKHEKPYCRDINLYARDNAEGEYPPSYNNFQLVVEVDQDNDPNTKDEVNYKLNDSGQIEISRNGNLLAKVTLKDENGAKVNYSEYMKDFNMKILVEDVAINLPVIGIKTPDGKIKRINWKDCLDMTIQASNELDNQSPSKQLDKPKIRLGEEAEEELQKIRFAELGVEHSEAQKSYVINNRGSVNAIG
jgi:hypothetical protein